MTDAYVGQIQTFAFKFAPRDWAFCNGALLNQSQYTALYGLIGVLYGGDAQQGTFKLPDAGGRILIGQGMAPGTSHNYQVGEQGGSPSVTLTTENMPAHTHILSALADQASNPSPPVGGMLGKGLALSESGDDSPVNLYAPADKDVRSLGGVSAVGGSKGFSVLNPYLVAIPCICLIGENPPRP